MKWAFILFKILLHEANTFDLKMIASVYLFKYLKMHLVSENLLNTHARVQNKLRYY